MTAALPGSVLDRPDVDPTLERDGFTDDGPMLRVGDVQYTEVTVDERGVDTARFRGSPPMDMVIMPGMTLYGRTADGVEFMAAWPMAATPIRSDEVFTCKFLPPHRLPRL